MQYFSFIGLRNTESRNCYSWAPTTNPHSTFCFKDERTTAHDLARPPCGNYTR